MLVLHVPILILSIINEYQPSKVDQYALDVGFAVQPS